MNENVISTVNFLSCLWHKNPESIFLFFIIDISIFIWYIKEVFQANLQLLVSQDIILSNLFCLNKWALEHLRSLLVVISTVLLSFPRKSNQGLVISRPWPIWHIITNYITFTWNFISTRKSFEVCGVISR
jgi:hypothetical protein